MLQQLQLQPYFAIVFFPLVATLVADEVPGEFCVLVYVGLLFFFMLVSPTFSEV